MANGAESSKCVPHWPTLPLYIATGDLRRPEPPDIGQKRLPKPHFKTQVVALKGWYNQKSIYEGSCVSVTHTM